MCGSRSGWRGRQESGQVTRPHRVAFSNCKLHQGQPPESAAGQSQDRHEIYTVSIVIVFSQTTQYTS